MLAPAQAADPQKLATEESATKFCKAGNVVDQPGCSGRDKTKSAGSPSFFIKSRGGCLGFLEPLPFRASLTLRDPDDGALVPTLIGRDHHECGLALGFGKKRLGMATVARSLETPTLVQPSADSEIAVSYQAAV